jgi:hypothetical protein
MADEERETLRRLEEQLSNASNAAERLIAEAARTSLGGKPPPAGWQTPGGARERPGARAEVETLLQAAQAVRDLIPADVIERLAAALRELLLAIRALIDWYLERIERRRAEPAEVQDIPID